VKSLFLFRHGKSDWSNASGEDHERPVSARGEKAARAMGRFLTLARQAPDSIVTSSAVRARTTVEIAARAGGWTCPIRTTRALYEATPFVVLEEARAEADTTERLLLAGHEPTWSELASLLVGGGMIRVPTAALLRIDFDAESWSGIAYGRGLLAWLVPPRVFTEGDFDFTG
jgi:phosphohistidine phosphatase